jgi:hypothetical protein
MWTNKLYAYTISFLLNTVILVYILRLPHRIAGVKNGGLIETYYYRNMWGSLVFDYVLVGIYFGIADGLMRWGSVKNNTRENSFIKGWVYLLLTILMISGGFYGYFMYMPKTELFFSKWFHAVGWKAVMYDMILLSCQYMLYRVILK